MKVTVTRALMLCMLLATSANAQEDRNKVLLKQIYSKLRVSSRTGLTKTETMTGVEAVLLTLREAVDRKEFNDFMSQLPVEFTRLLPSPNPPRAV